MGGFFSLLLVSTGAYCSFFLEPRTSLSIFGFVSMLTINSYILYMYVSLLVNVC